MSLPAMLILVIPAFFCSAEKEFFPQKLTQCTVYEIRADEPVFTRLLDEGDVAYYGLLLQAHGGGALRDYLLKVRRDFLWEYNWDYGVTAEDSAIVLEGLLSDGVKAADLAGSTDRLVREYYHAASGGFKTVLNARARYWDAPAVVTTAHIAWLLSQIAPDKYRAEIQTAVTFLKRRQLTDGSWKGEWFPSRALPVYYALRFLALQRQHSEQAVQKAIAYLQATQSADGSWWGSPIDTAVAVLALRAVQPAGQAQAHDKGIAWLRKRLKSALRGEGILYYWFEHDKPQRKEFFHCIDQGQIAQAWVTLALSGR